nr:ras-related protein Rab-8B isoform X2 [Taeniopygia guttata]
MEPAGLTPSSELTLKLLLVGDSGVGKSSLLRRFMDGAFDPRLTPTVGVDFKTKKMVLEGRAVQLAIWVGLFPDRWGMLGFERCICFKSCFLWFLHLHFLPAPPLSLLKSSAY